MSRKNPLSLLFRSNAHDACWLLLQAPRFLVPYAALSLLLGGAGCVSNLKYEEASSAAAVEAEARRRAQLSLEQERARTARLEQELVTRDQRLTAGEQKLEEENYQRHVLAKQQGETSFVVDQLRSDLSRASQNLASYADEKARLERELKQARERQAASDPLVAFELALSRELSGTPLGKAVALERTESELLLRVAADTLFEPATARLAGASRGLFEAVLRELSSRPLLKLQLRESEVDPAVAEALGSERRTRLMEPLGASALAERIGFLSLPPGAVGGAGSYELSVSRSPEGSPAPSPSP